MKASNPFKNNNNNNKNVNNRFNCLKEDPLPQILPQPQAKSKPQQQVESISLNNRFDSLKESNEIRDEFRDEVKSRPMPSRSVFRRNKLPEVLIKPVSKPFIYKQDEFPDIMSSSNKVKDLAVDIEEAAIDIIYVKDTTNSYNKAIIKTNTKLDENVEEKQRNVNPGWVSIVRNYNTGKTQLIYGPKTTEQKQREFLENNLNHHMINAITNMSIRWDRDKQKYDDIHGQGSFQDNYGYVPTYGEEYSNINENDDDYEDDEY